MPLSFPPPPYAYCETFYSVLGASCYMRFFFGGASDTNDQTTADALASWYSSTFIDPLINMWNVSVIHSASNAHVRTTSNLYSQLAEGLESGTVMGELMPPQNTMNVTWAMDNTGGGTRLVRGRTFISGWSEDTDVGGNWDGTVTSALNALCDQLRAGTSIMGTPFELRVWRPQYNILALVTGNSVSTIPKCLRHRRPPR